MKLELEQQRSDFVGERNAFKMMGDEIPGNLILIVAAKKNQSAQSTFIETAATSTSKLIKRFSLLQAYSNLFRSTTEPIRLTVSSQT